ncbi:MAG: serine hydrolase domain-containing protein [Cellulosilyticaceae bacterium]
MKKFSALAIALSLLVAATQPIATYAQVVAPITQTTFEQNMEAHIKALAPMIGAKSVQYTLMEKGEIIATSGIGETTDTLYCVGSVSKMYTTLAVMQLVEDGKVDLDTPVVTYIPEFKMADERYKQITPRMLLNHSSGLMGSTLKNMLLFEDNDHYATENLLAALQSQRLKADPGAYSVYCNDGFTLAEILVEHVSGVSFTEYIHQNMTGPLALQNTKTSQESWDDEQIAKTYNVDGSVLPTEVVNNIGTGGVYATTEDLCRVGEVFTGQREGILSDEMVEQTMNAEYAKGMWPAKGDGILAFGLGWDNVNAYPFNEYGIQALVKGGDTIGYHASLIVLPEYDMVAAVASSGSLSTYNQMVATTLLMERLKENGVIKEEKPVPNFGVPKQVALTKDVMAYAGNYGTMGAVLKIEMIQEGKMNLSFVGNPDLGVQSFVHIGKGEFLTEDGSAKVSFVQETNGEIYLRVDGYVGVPGLGTLATSEYQAQKLPENVLSQEVEKAWQARDGKAYYMLDEKYSSLTHASGQVMILQQEQEMPGYITNIKIVSKDEAKSVIQIPGNYGRDVSDLRFYQKDGVEYVQVGCYTAIGEDGLQVLDIQTTKQIVIGEDGYAKWYKISDADANKKVHVEIIGKGSFAVCDADGNTQTFSEIAGPEAMLCPSGDMMFAGEPGTVFKLTEVIE